RRTDGSCALTNPPVSELALPPSQIEELWLVLSKGLRATQLYLPNNPVYQRAVDNIRPTLRQIWEATDDLAFDVGETEIRWEDAVDFLEDKEIAYLKKDVEREYAQDLRRNVLAMLFDLLELQTYGTVRAELISIVENFIPYLLGAADFRSVAFILRDTRVILQRARELIPEHRQTLESLPARLSQREALSQLIQSLDEATVHPTEEELSELFQELRAEALPTLMGSANCASPRCGSSPRAATATRRRGSRAWSPARSSRTPTSPRR